jgi:antitoxin component YwqK of YwqJK toxin-antitoxin module
MNKLFTPFNFLITLMILFVALAAHLMYGNCQTTKFHFIVQTHYMPYYLPNLLLKYNKDTINYSFGDYNYTGKWQTWYKNGVKESEVDCRVGIYDGTYTKWYESGAKQIESKFINGKENGIRLCWHENGTLKSKWEFKMGILVGKFINWDENGEKIEEKEFKDGL